LKPNNLTYCYECGASDEGTKLQIINDEECQVCTVCESEKSVRDIDYSEWIEMMEADDADRYNDELAVSDDS
jgi:hypothetical protein